MNIDYNVIEHQMSEDGGILRTQKVLNHGVKKNQLYSFIKEKNLVKEGHGLYVFEDAWVDDMYLLQLRFPKIIYSMETALYLHGLSEREPMPLSVTVPAKYNTKELIASGVNIGYVKNEWYEIGVSEVLSPEGNKLRAYDPERTICDIIRKKNEMDISAFNYAINEYMRNNGKDLNKLMKYAQELKIEKTLRTIMGVLF